MTPPTPGRIMRIMPSDPARQPAWILYRRLDEFPIPDSVVLQRWAERGRIEPDDFLLNPRSDACVQAKEITELRRSSTR